MIDAKHLRYDIDTAATALAKRGYSLDINFWQTLEEQRKALQSQTEQLQAERNAGAKQIGLLKREGKDTSEIMASMQSSADRIKQLEEELKRLQETINQHALELPNLPAAEVPAGRDENDNVEIRQWGTPKTFDFTVQDHTDLGEKLAMLNFEAAAKITGSRFSVLTGQLAKLHRALIQFMLDTHVDKYGYTEVYLPYIVNADSLYGTGQLPKFSEDLFKLHGEREFYLIPTAEVPMTNLVRGEILNPEQLPLKFTAHTPCFRSEAGAYGKDTRGLIRQHQFEKVEMVNVCLAEQSEVLLENMTAQAEYILQMLNLPYRVMLLCAGDMGFSAQKTYDIEVWLPSQNCYREISSCSNCGDFQARRMQTRAKTGKKTELVHTLNGSGLAVGRTLLAIMENYQQANGSIAVPEVLQPYMGGIKAIG